MQRRTLNIEPNPPTGNGGGRSPTRQLAARDLHHVLAVQDARVVSLVRVDPSGRATCDCATYHATKQPCEHIAAAARLLGERAL